MKTRNKPKRLTPADIDRAFAGLPNLAHINAASIPLPGALLAAWKRSYRQIAVSRSQLTKAQWKAIVDQADTSQFRAQAIVDLFDAIYRNMDEQVIRDQCPPWESHVELGRGRYVVRWSRIAGAEINGRLLYYWPDRPRIEFNRGSWIAAFSVHAIVRMIERLDADNHSRLQVTRLMHATHAEPFKNGYWLWCDASTLGVGKTIVKALTGSDDVRRHQLRVCYVPVKFNGKFAVATTVLCPSMVVPKVHEALVSYQAIKRGSDRTIAELRRLHATLPMIREVNRRPTLAANPVYMSVLAKTSPDAHAALVKEAELERIANEQQLPEVSDGETYRVQQSRRSRN